MIAEDLFSQYQLSLAGDSQSVFRAVVLDTQLGVIAEQISAIHDSGCRWGFPGVVAGLGDLAFGCRVLHILYMPLGWGVCVRVTRLR